MRPHLHRSRIRVRVLVSTLPCLMVFYGARSLSQTQTASNPVVTTPSPVPVSPSPPPHDWVRDPKVLFPAIAATAALITALWNMISFQLQRRAQARQSAERQAQLEKLLNSQAEVRTEM